MSLGFLLLGVALILQPSLAIDDGSACRYLTNLLEDLPRQIPTTTFKSHQDTSLNGYLVNLTCDLELPITASREWCMLLNDANCSCNVTRTYSNVTTVGRRLQWNVPKRDIVTFDGTLIGCFVEERLVMAVYARGTEDVGTSEPGDLTTVKVVSTVLGLLSTAIFVLPCCVLSYFMTVKRVKRKRKEKREESDGKTPRRGSFQPGVPNPNVKLKDIQPGTRIGNGRFGEVQKAVVQSICGESPLRSLACVKIFQDASSQNRMQRCQALRKVELRKNLAPHVNLINFLGACSGGKQVLLVVELGVFGTLHSFLEAKRRAKVSRTNHSYPPLESGKKEHLEVAYAKECKPPTVKEVVDVFTAPLETAMTSEDILAIAEQIAKALLHLSQLSIVHKRLTCESVYIGANYCIKVGGFSCEKGASQPLMRRTSMLDNGPQLTERTPNGRPLAWWSAPEVIDSLLYSQLSDVWSFAMTLWELASDGDTPMQGCGADKTSDLPDLFCNKGVKPSQPASCSEMLFSIMNDCWEVDPQNRPGFHYVSLQLSRQLHGPAQGQANSSFSRAWRPSPLPDVIEDMLEEDQ